MKKICENCERSIGNLEKSFLFKNHVVCKACKTLLEENSESLEVVNKVNSEIPIKQTHPEVCDNSEQETITYHKGKVQIGIGIVVCLLLLFGIGVKIFSVYTEYSITSNRELLIELGYNPDSFTRTTSYWVTHYSLHFFGLITLLLYLMFILKKKYKAAILIFIFCSAYFLICAIINITDLTPEQKMRGYTIGGWIGRIISWLPKYVIELGLLVQGLLGVRKYNSTSRQSF